MLAVIVARYSMRNALLVTFYNVLLWRHKTNAFLRYRLRVLAEMSTYQTHAIQLFEKSYPYLLPHEYHKVRFSLG